MIGSRRVDLFRRCTRLTNPSLHFPQACPPLPRPYSRIPLVVTRPSSTSPPNLVVSGKLRKFPVGVSDFSRIRKLPGRAYFDKTGYISELEEGAGVQLVCRPRRFGKSLTVTTLRYFHGFQFRDQYDKLFKGLNVDEAVSNGTIQPGRYLLLEFDFSQPTRPHDLDQSAQFIGQHINMMLSIFIRDYTKYLGESFASQTSTFTEKSPAENLARLIHAIYLLADEYDACANDYMDPHNPRLWSDAAPSRLLKGFWSNVKAGGKLGYGIQKVYITGVTPLLLSDLFSGANDQENISFSPLISTICGLTRSDVLEALKVICNNEEEVQAHLRELEHNANGYHFCDEQSVEPVFNTHTALSYLEVSGGRRPKAVEAPNSEVSESFLEACAGAPRAVNEIQLALQKDEHGAYRKIPYDTVLRSFKLSELAASEGDISAWRSLMVYMGGLTFDMNDPSNSLKIPNLIAAKRFGFALLDRLDLYHFMINAVHTLAETGNPKDVLAGYCHMMRERDVFGDAFLKKEEHHRDNIRWGILQNDAMQSTLEYQVTKVSNSPGFVDLLITDNKNLYTLIEFKNIQIPYLELSGEDNIGKVKGLDAMKLNDILKLKFKGDKYRTGSINNWIDGRGHGPVSGSVRNQLQSYITGPTVQKEIANKDFRAFAVVIVGSRQILVREMDRHGKWVSKFQLVNGNHLDKMAGLGSKMRH
ncbi:uncharacterized protein Z518_02329 [Rhinocladiella mackenziei CBS 650.93]|uniref:Rhinocladiella mackenziei CBS 650.93 unplaced genomic scaffold supercont1.2, whole genome shotgun sequence n=1 Tax=Rhinocladiella mackenziei CBS 650.93 TaxID=1442369 RepID=A0A0D2JEQ1_9EURO|nr:uncharacterized protein Z518_02329 [Rhinocladiella mackenziei CBS 650.93]KIX07675.1 hypothetical protein Z518_02329 [Rhinocladiella mackenziei CBS 650.93]